MNAAVPEEPPALVFVTDMARSMCAVVTSPAVALTRRDGGLKVLLRHLGKPLPAAGLEGSRRFA